MRHEPLILIVEDDEPVARMIADYLGTLGYRTTHAYDGREAVARVNELRPDLIVMDLMLPRLTGGEAAKALRGDPLTTRIPIVAISAVADVTSIADLLPVDAIVPKPFDLDALRSAIEQLLRPHTDAPAAGAAHP